MRIQHNIMAMNAYRNYSNNTSALAKNLEKLSSGYRINRAGDDAAGLAISEKMRAQITGLKTAQKNAKDGISLVQTAEGALTEVHDMLNRMVELADQSANGTYDDDVDRANLQKEFDALRTEIDRIADSSNFNGKKLLDGTLGAYAETKAIAGAAAKPEVQAEFAEMSFDVSGMSLATGESLKIGDLTITATATMTAGQIAAAISGTANISGTAFTASVSGTTVTLKAQASGAVTGINQAVSEIYVDKGTSSVSGLATTSVDVTVTGAAATKATFSIEMQNMAKTFVTTNAPQITVSGVTFTAAGTAAGVTEADFLTALSGATGNIGGVDYTISVSGTKLVFTASAAGNATALAAGVTSIDVTGGATISGAAGSISVTAATNGADAKSQKFEIDMTGATIPTGDGLKIGDKEFANLAAVSGNVTISGNTYAASVSGNKIILENTATGADSVDKAKIVDSIKSTKGSTTIATTVANKGVDYSAATSATGGTNEMAFGDKQISAGYKVTIGEGDDAVTFEFIASGDTAASGNVAVTVGADLDATLSNFNAALSGATLADTTYAVSGRTFTFTNTDAADLNKSPRIKQDGAGLTLQIGEDSNDYNQLTVAVGDMHANALGIGTGDVNIDTQANAQAAVEKLKEAINSVSSTRGGLGATQNRLEHTINNLSVMQENIQDAESSIRDVDVADEMMAYTKNNILVQSAQAMLAQANQVPQGVLQLLQ